MGQMASGIAHDLNQGLALMSGYSELAGEALAHIPANVEQAREMLAIIGQAAARSGESVKRLLTFARPQAEQTSEPIDVGTMLHDVARLTAPRWREIPQREGRAIALHVDVADDVTILGWPVEFAEAVTNLIFNAVDALPRGGVIDLRGSRRDDQVVVEVSDSGLGMPPDICKRIFDPFFTTKGESGTGLGLTMVLNVTEHHGGQLTVESVPGQGTTFRMMLPGVEQKPKQRDDADRLPAIRPLRILAVDDEPALARMIGLMLAPRGHRVETAESGEEALRALAIAEFDMVITDLGLGAGMSGWDLAANVKERWPTVRVTLATGWGAAIDPVEARDRGVDAVISKPYRYATLEGLLRNDTAADLP
jgi:CheY-like chemotaxis protein